AGGGRSEDDAVEAELHFADVGYAGGDAGLSFGIAHRTGGIGDVDGVATDALAELLEATAGAARADHRHLEFGEGGAVFLGDDRGEGQPGGRAGDLNGVARLGEGAGGPGGAGREQGCCAGKKSDLHEGSL